MVNTSNNLSEVRDTGIPIAVNKDPRYRTLFQNKGFAYRCPEK